MLLVDGWSVAAEVECEVVVAECYLVLTLHEVLELVHAVCIAIKVEVAACEVTSCHKDCSLLVADDPACLDCECHALRNRN